MSGSHLSPEELTAYVDSQVERVAWKRIVGHLAACDTCFRELVAIIRLTKASQREGQ